MNTIAIDCGASFIKGAIISDDGVIMIRREQQAPPVRRKQDIMKPIHISSLFTMVEEMIEELASNEKEVKLCISNEMHGFILAYADGTPYTDYVPWQKEYGTIKIKGESAIDILNREEYQKDIWISGMPLRKGLPSCNLLYLRRMEALKRQNDRLFFYTLGDYIIHRFARVSPVCHPTNMAATGFYDIKRNAWNQGFIRKICDGNVVFPKKETERDKSVIVIDRKGCRYHIYPAIGDQQAALLGAGLENSATLSFNLGTGAQVSVLTEKIDLGTGYQIRPYFEGKYIKTIPHLPSGRALNVYIRFFEDILKQFGIKKDRDEIWRVLLEASETEEKTNLICDMSFFENPITDYNVGSIKNIGEYDFCVGTLLNGIFGQMVKNFIWAAERIQQDRQKIKKIIFSGGVARKIKKLRNGIAQHYSEDIEIKIAKDETLIGLYKYGNGESIWERK